MFAWLTAACAVGQIQICCSIMDQYKFIGKYTFIWVRVRFGLGKTWVRDVFKLFNKLDLKRIHFSWLWLNKYDQLIRVNRIVDIVCIAIFGFLRFSQL